MDDCKKLCKTVEIGVWRHTTQHRVKYECDWPLSKASLEIGFTRFVQVKESSEVKTG